MRRAAGWAIAAVLAAALAGGCRSDEAAGAGGRLSVVTTVSPITSIVASVAGDAADVTGVVPEGTNSHTYEPAPSVAAVMADADLIFVNGLGLEDPTADLATANKRAGTEIVALGDRVVPQRHRIYDFAYPRSGGKPNPHVWTDPTYARKYAEVARDALQEADPPRRDVYARNFEVFAAEVDALDAALRAATATLPAEHRKLLTYHDAYAYFARTYGWTVIGAIQVENFDEPSPREVAALIDQVRREKVKAIFGSEVFPSPVLEQIGRETGVRYVDVLRDDDLPGRPGDPEHSWLGLMRFDYVTMVEALGGNASALAQLEFADASDDHATYPQ